MSPIEGWQGGILRKSVHRVIAQGSVAPYHLLGRRGKVRRA
ncbi:MAG: hypothetical protein ACE5LL_07355 [Alphaproteobacteria bacterium]